MGIRHIHQEITDNLSYFFPDHISEMEELSAISYTREYMKEKSDGSKSLDVETNSEISRREQSEVWGGNIPHQRYLVAGQFIEDMPTYQSVLKIFWEIIKGLLEIEIFLASNNQSIQLVTVE